MRQLTIKQFLDLNDSEMRAESAPTELRLHLRNWVTAFDSEKKEAVLEAYRDFTRKSPQQRVDAVAAMVSVWQVVALVVGVSIFSMGLVLFVMWLESYLGGPLQ